MLWLVIKSLISGVLVGIVSEAAKRSAAMGALVSNSMGRVAAMSAGPRKPREVRADALQE